MAASQEVFNPIVRTTLAIDAGVNAWSGGNGEEAGRQVAVVESNAKEIVAFGGTAIALGSIEATQSAAPADLKGSDDKPAFLVTPNGVVLPPGQDYDLVDPIKATNQGGEWMQVHGTHARCGRCAAHS